MASLSRSLLCLVFVLSAGCVSAEGETAGPGASATVVDGDTLEVNGQRIRIWGVDAPESAQVCERDGEEYRCGLASAAALSDWVARRPATCVEVERDQYDRSVARCSVEGEDVGAWLVLNGHALDYRHYSRGAYAREEARARTAGLGVHGGRFDAPWEWRRAQRVASEQAPPDPRCVIKGNINAKGARIFHTPQMRSYAATRIDTAAGERWFCSEAQARAAGWRAPGE